MLAVAIVLAGVAFVVLWRELSAKNRPRKPSKLAAGAAGVLLAMLLFLAATGRLHWLAALLAGALPFIRWIAGFFIAPLIGNLLRSGFGAFGRRSPFGASGGTAGGPSASTVATADLDMTLDHESGQMDGTVLTGDYAGRRLSELDRAALQRLYGELTAEDSRQLLGAYLERRFPDWAADGSGGADGEARRQHDGGQEMSASQALAVLGLAADASEEEVVAAHRRLMQKLHPDRGGTTYLAATLNRAKEVLLKG